MNPDQLRSKLIGSEDERAVSPVIGVILMVAITVILAAVIAAFVLDLGQGQSANAQAGIQFDQDGSIVTITVNSVDRADVITVTCDSGDQQTWNSPSAGDTTEVDTSSNCGSSAIQVIGEYDGSENVITSYDEHL